MTILSSPLTHSMGIEVHMTSAKSLRSRVRRNSQARFCRRVRGSDSPFDSSGVGVQSSLFTLWMGHLVLPFKTIKERMELRRVMRRARRGRRINRKLPYNQRSHRQTRFDNRKQGKLPPSIRANRQLELRVVNELFKLFPISAIHYELVMADVDRTSGRKSAKSGVGFSPVMVGQVRFVG